ncbi:MAG: carbohydrate ABC transporter permease [Acidisphaera sp.]|nr:carbohydrate ABC transporter permease [Acidisphaera sp.]
MHKVSHGGTLTAYALLVAATAVSLVPTIYMVDISLRNSVDSFTPVLIAPHVTFANWSAILSQRNLVSFFISSALVSIITVVFTLLCVIGLSYAISRLKIPGRQLILVVVVSALLLPLASLLVPIAKLLEALDLTNNYLGLIGPETALGIPFGTVIVKAAMDDIPEALEEAARIDGAGPFTILVRIVVPLISPSLIVVAIWQFLYSWNEFFLALVIMTKDALKTLPLAPLYYEGPFMTDPGRLFAVLTLIAIVPMLVYILLQRWFVAGLMEGSVKG